MMRQLTLGAVFVLSACQATPLISSSASAPAALQSFGNASELPLEKWYTEVFNEHDLNRNGFIEPQEIPHAPSTFAKQDRNKDGRLSLAEALPDHGYLTQTQTRLQKELRTWHQEQHMRTSFSSFQKSFIDEVNQLSQEPQTQIQPSQHNIPVLLVPGYAEPSWYFMYGMYRDLKKAGFAVEGINLFPNFAPAQEQARKVKARVEHMLKKYKAQKVHLVVHSYGGLISRYFIQNMGGQSLVSNLVTVATPHQGTYAAHLGPGESASQMEPGSDFLKALNNQGFTRPGIKYGSVWTNLDEIVLPPKHAIMPDSTVYYVPWRGHLTIMFSDKTYEAIRAELLG